MAYTPPGETRQRILEWMRERLIAGEPPTVREVQRAFEFKSVQSARAHLEALVEAGALEKTAGRSRSYRLPAGVRAVNQRVSQAAERAAGRAVQVAAKMGLYDAEGIVVDPMRLVPLLGRVQAGEMTTAVEEHEEFIPFQTTGSSSGMGSDDFFALRVHGESMVGVGILPGDVVLVRRRFEVRSGDIVVALVGDEATVKTLRKRQGRIELEPANPEFETIVPDPAELHILGKVVEVRRSLEGSLPTVEIS